MVDATTVMRCVAELGPHDTACPQPPCTPQYGAFQLMVYTPGARFAHDDGSATAPPVPFDMVNVTRAVETLPAKASHLGSEVEKAVGSTIVARSVIEGTRTKNQEPNTRWRSAIDGT